MTTALSQGIYMSNTKVTRIEEGNKTIEELGYRPFIELDCPLIKHLYSNESKKAEPIVIADVGAARGFDPRWNLFGKNCIQVGFEPEPEEFKVLTELYRGNDTRHIVPFALANTNGPRTLYVTRDTDSSSLYKPYTPFFARLQDPAKMDVVKTIEVETRTLDSVPLPISESIDVLKMDVQGAELDVLKGAERIIGDGLLAVVSEAEFTTEYYNQPLFADLDMYLRSKGFQLFDLDVRRWRRRDLNSDFTHLRSGQIIYGDVLYLKDPVEYWDKFCKKGLEREKLLKLIALSEFYSAPDFGIELLEFGEKKGLISNEERSAYTPILFSNRIVKTYDRGRKPGK